MKDLEKSIIWSLWVMAIIVIILVVCFACKTPQPIVQEKIKEVHTETIVRDTIVTIAADTAQARLLLECDSAGNVMLREIEQLQGDRLSLQTNLKRLQNVTGSPVVVDITCKEDSLQRIIDIQSKRIKELKAEKITETRVEKYIPAFYKWCTWLFGAY